LKAGKEWVKQSSDRYKRGVTIARCSERLIPCGRNLKGEVERMNAKSRFLVGVLTALAMMLLTFALPRGGPMRDAAVVQFPMTVGIWAIFVLLFVKLK
jgi:hypothetical protein